MESGYLIFEEKSSPYIDPEKIKNAFEHAFREYAFEIPVNIQMLELSNDLETMVEFVHSLKKLFLIEFSSIRHSNPSPRSKFFDEAADARIDNMTESTTNPEGIDRESELFKNQISHIQHSYGRIRRAEGQDNYGFREMELEQGKIKLTVVIENQETDTKIKKMLSIFSQIKDKLSMD